MFKNKKKRFSQTDKENPYIHFIKKTLWGSFFSLVFFFILIFIFSLIVLKFNISELMQTVLVFSSCLLSTFLGSFTVLGKIKEKGLISGFLSAVPAVLTLCLILLIFLHSLGLKTIIMALLMLAGGAIGGIVAMNRKK